MKFYVKSRKEIQKNGVDASGCVGVSDGGKGDSFIPEMYKFCGKGPFEFKSYCHYKRWFTFDEYFWHISWLTKKKPSIQYLLEFE